MTDREWLECPCCGEDAIESDEEGLFNEDQGGPCPDCGCLVSVVIDEETGAWSDLYCPDDCACCRDQDEPVDRVMMREDAEAERDECISAAADRDARMRREEREEDEAVERHYEGEVET